jgi:Ca-activated chloride channel family protein
MGDALMRVLDIAESIKADSGMGSTGAATPSPSADPGTSAAPDPSASPAPSASGAPVDEPSGEPLVAAILLSDGANSVGETEPLDAADRAAKLNVPVYTIALGTPNGQIQVRDDNGQLVTLDVPPDTETLAQIAEVTGATAFDAATAQDLSAVYDNLQSRIGYTEETQEITFAFAAAALVLVVAGAGLSALWFGRLP